MRNMKKQMNQIIEIRCSDYTAKINLMRGANCVSLRSQKYGASILREPPSVGELDNPYLYGMPILFPVNRIENGTFAFEGREYRFPINETATGCHLHGELHRMSFECVGSTESRVICRYRANTGEYLGFPHAFEIIQEYELTEQGLRHTVTVSNLSELNMPVFLGFHTTFNTRFLAESRSEDIRAFADVTEEFERNMAVNYLPTGVKLPFDAVSEALSKGSYQPFTGKISRHYRGFGKMMLTDVKKRVRMVYDSDGKFGFRLIFNGGDDGYICLEPQNCLANCQNAPFPRSETGFDWIEAGKSKKYCSSIYLEECDV